MISLSVDSRAKRHVFRVTDDLPSNEEGSAEIGGIEIFINSRQVDGMNRLRTDPKSDSKTGP